MLARRMAFALRSRARRFSRRTRSSTSCTLSATSPSSATAISRSPRRSGSSRGQRQIQHGILRDFPTTYTRPDGSRVVVGFDVQSVTLDGAEETWTTEGLTNGVRVRIGRADVSLSIGEHEYVIRYRTTRQIGFFADYDELYWNATGTGWTFAIDFAEARITLPEAVPFRQSAVYTGPQGSRGQDAAIVEQQPGHIKFRTTRPLPPGNGLTVAASWQKGIVTAPTATPADRLVAGGQSSRGRRRRRTGRRARLLRVCLAAVRPRSGRRHHHSAVWTSRGHVGGGCALCRAHAIRRPLLHRGDCRSRGRRACQAHRRRARRP